MKKYKIVIPVKWSLISENRQKFNPIIRAITVWFFADEDMQLPFHVEMPPPDRDNVVHYKIVSLSVAKGIKGATKISLNDEAIAKMNSFYKYGMMKPFSLTLEIPKEVVQNIRDWQWYYRMEMDRGLTPDMAQQTNDNEHYKRHKEKRAAANRGGNSSRGSRSGDVEDDRGKDTGAGRKALPTVSGKKVNLRPKG